MSIPSESPASLAQRIDLTRDTDVAFWCRLLDVDATQLRRAIQHVGPQVQAVHRHLQQQAQPHEGSSAAG